MEQKEESESQESEEICVLCKHPMVESESITVCTPKGMKSILELSILRNDGLSQYFKGQKITLHNKCRKKYTRIRDDKPVDFEDKTEWIVTVEPKSKSKEKIKKPKVPDGYQRWYTRVLHALDSTSCGNEEPFDFKETCFICGSIFNKKRLTNKKYNVSRDSTKETLIKTLTADSGNPVKKAILHRIEYVDLVAVEAGYHKSCYFYLTMRIRKPAKNKRFYKTNSAMQIIYEHIEQSGDIQFSVPQLKGLITDANYELADRTILKYLQEKYQERIIVVNVPGTGNVVTFIEEDILN